MGRCNRLGGIANQAPLESVYYTYTDSTWKDLLTSYNGQTITYDQVGNPLTYRDGITFTWQNGRELANFSNNNYDITYSYDADGMRTTKSIDVLGDVKYVYEGNLLLQMDYLGKIFDFSYDANGTPIGFRYNDDGAISYYYYGVNSRGDIVSIFDSEGKKIIGYSYDAYGKPISIVCTSDDSFIANTNPLRYRGYVYDKETGLYYVSSRYYDPETCRFLNADTTDVLTATLTAHTDKNLFAYCDNNPVVRVDVDGQFWESPFDIITLGMSVVEVISNPCDPLNWVGLGGDIIDLIPFVSGVGEAARIVKVVDKADDVVDVAKVTYKAADKTSAIRKATGAYEISFESGNTYVGKGGFKRAITSATQKADKYGDTVTSIKWHSSPSHKQAFIDEYLLQEKQGGVLSSNPNLNTYNKIWSPGRRYFRTK